MNFISQYLLDFGFPSETVALILILPIVATVIALARQIIGIKGFGIYTPLIIAFAFLETGLKYGLIIFSLIIIVGILMRFLVKRVRILYLPRMAIIITGVALAILILFFLATYLKEAELISISVFAILIMITLVEKFVAAQIERGTRQTILLTLETLLLSLVCFLLASWSWLQGFVLNYSLAIIIGAVIINLLAGNWKGLRLTEYLRFREVIKYVELPKKK